ncbi:MAG: hypothetical protein B6I22_11805 [Desulfobacteraceae bacterium 4572_123]|nr:MAG: hypothetical protein B6I22_11805 [Desulfobacteraceae bacterium 4572_123]
MSTNQDAHLNEDQLLRVFVDKVGLPDTARTHLAGCPLCRAKKQRIENDLAAFGKIARQSVPKQQKRVRLPADASPSRKLSGWYRLTAMGAAVAVLLVISVIWWPGRGLLVPDKNTPVAAWDRQDDEKFMAQIRVLTENDLPQVYLDISAGLDYEDNEEFIDFVVPSLDQDSLSYDFANRRSLS